MEELEKLEVIDKQGVLSNARYETRLRERAGGVE